jgi:hypothetical protein
MAAIWFLTLIWFAEILGNLSAFDSVSRLQLACGLSATPVVLLYGCRYLQSRRKAAAWRSPPPDPEPQYTPPPQPPPPPPPPVFKLLGLNAPFTRTEVLAAFRRRAMDLHPDHGGDEVLFRLLVAERDRAMAMAR